ncbi:unnamed protein product [Porites lobata]|uniref:Integrase catalytic domain-containing protein n=1 Tax=Porites lobata TaxID=104759 RepID=A0ABN8N097_9CNID|nr:unnamed protein product [Porites lobata]
MGAVTKLMKEIGTFIRCGRVDIHRDQVIVERFNRTLAERLFGHQYAVEMRLSKGQRSSEWVVWLPAATCLNERKKIPSLVYVRYLCQRGELEGGRKRATDPIWITIYNIEKSVTKPGKPVLYYVQDGPKRGFVRS